MVSLTAYKAARHSAAIVDRLDRGRIVVAGADRASYLHGLLTNDIVSLTTGTGCYAAYLTPQGRMITDLFVYELGETMLLSVPREQKDGVLAKLDQFVFNEDVQLGDATGTFYSIAIVGPEAARVVADVLGERREDLQLLAEHANRRASFQGGAAVVTRVTDTGEPGYDVYVEAAQGAALRQAAVAAGAVETDVATAEAIRIEAAIPKFNRDMDENTIPLEAGIESRAISLSKGCYVGQEVIIRVLHRGHGRVARKLVGILCEGDQVPPSGAVVTDHDRDVGRITSSAMSPALGRPIALAYVHRDAATEGTVVSMDGVSGVVAPRPFVG
jgi:folate-binding protein YgfZ